MRAIKFRGKRVDNGEWVFGAFVPDALECSNSDLVSWGFIRRYNRRIGKMETIEVDRQTVGQYTGLKDKYGVEIYEGDILEGFSVYPTKDTFQSKTLGNVYYSNRGTWDCCSFLLGDINEQMEVIGNIYNNPELMGGR